MIYLTFQFTPINLFVFYWITTDKYWIIIRNDTILLSKILYLRYKHILDVAERNTQLVVIFIDTLKLKTDNKKAGRVMNIFYKLRNSTTSDVIVISAI